MKKTTFSIISLAAIMALTGCSKEASAGSKPFKPVVAPTSIEVSTKSKALYVGESYQLTTLLTPLLSTGSTLLYESSDESVATVSKSGKITGKGKGSCIVTVKAEADEDVYQQVKVYVEPKYTDEFQIDKQLKMMRRYQEDNVQEPRKLKTHEVETRSLYRNGKLHHDYVGYEDFIIDKDNAYFYVGGLDVEKTIEGGQYARSVGGWHINTDSQYISYLYHDGQDSKKVLIFSTASYSDKERYEVVYGVLDSLFSSGREIAENNIEDSLGKDIFRYTTMINAGGWTDNKTLIVDLKGGSDEPDISTATMEQNLDIPAGIPYYEKDTIRVFYDRGNVKYYNLRFDLSYKYKGVNYVFTINREYTFERDDEFTYSMPNRAEYDDSPRNVFDL